MDDIFSASLLLGLQKKKKKKTVQVPILLMAKNKSNNFENDLMTKGRSVTSEWFIWVLYALDTAAWNNNHKCFLEGITCISTCRCNLDNSCQFNCHLSSQENYCTAQNNADINLTINEFGIGNNHYFGCYKVEISLRNGWCLIDWHCMCIFVHLDTDTRPHILLFI